MYGKASNESGYYTYDEAKSRFGSKLPTKNQYEELSSKKCKWTWTGSGYNVQGPNGNKIYLPAAGWRSDYDGEVYEVSYGRYWSSTSNTSEYAWGLNFSSGGYLVNSGVNYECFDGRSVRLVQSK